MRITGFLLVLAAAGVVLWAGTSAVAAPDAASACPAGTKRAVIGGKVKCLRAGQACKLRYQAAYKRYGFRCVAGHLRKNTPKPPVTPPVEPPPPPAPPPPPPPRAQPGHYKGTTSQLTVIEFDVTADSSTVLNLATGQVNQGCTPHASLYGGGVHNVGAAILPDLTFRRDFVYDTSVGSDPAHATFTITGQFSGAAATGTLQASVTFTHEGVAYACGSGLQTWTATRTG
jgi:hypothetical protein